jgi:hypothetical protein
MIVLKWSESSVGRVVYNSFEVINLLPDQVHHFIHTLFYVFHIEYEEY